MSRSQNGGSRATVPGLSRLRNQISRQLTRHRPRADLEYNGVHVHPPWLIDRTGDRADHEVASVSQLRAAIEPGDEVVVVGGGSGCTAVHAARFAGRRGHVTVFEGAVKWAEACRRALEDPRNDVECAYDVREAVVADARDVWGIAADDRRAPDTLPSCDVLELDAEGAELDILEGYLGDAGLRPRTVVVETHPGLGCPDEAVEAVLHDHSYRVQDRETDRADGDTSVLRASR